MFQNFLSALSLFVLISYTSVTVEAKEVKMQTIRVDVATSLGILLAEIHFDKKDEINAQRVKSIIENDFIKVIEYFQYVPKDIVHINLDPYLKISNGNAVVFPTNIINLYQLPPSQSSHLLGINDWLRGVLFHEFIHITHLDLTRGLWSGARTIFGSIAKIPAGTVPSWFTEGIAVWGESYLLEGGRLHHPAFNKEMIVYFLRDSSCKTIDCLDRPGLYPYGSLPYLAGAHFLEFVENKKPKTIACLVKKNASKIPFFLNSVFEECAGENAEVLFGEFREEFLHSQAVASIKLYGEKQRFINQYGVDDLQKGQVTDGAMLFKVEHDRFEEALVSYELGNNSNKHLVTKKFEAPIAEVTQVINSKYLLASFNEDPHFREVSKFWKLINTQTLNIEKNLSFTDDPQYVISIGEEVFLTASFKNLRWQLGLETLRSDFKATETFAKLSTFDPGFNLLRLETRNHKVFIKYYHNEEYVLGVMESNDLKNGILKITNLYKSKSAFSENFISSRAVMIFDDHSFNRIVDLESVPLKQYQMSESYHLKYNVIIKEAELQNILDQSELILSEVASNEVTITNNEVPLINQRVYDYPSWSHFIPHFWFLTTGTSENISSIGVYTEFNDPMNFTNFSLSVITYPEDRKWGGSLSIDHKFQNPSDLLKFNAQINREYFKSNLSKRLNQEHEGTFSLFYNILRQKWVYTPGFFIGYKDSKDFVASNSLFNQGLIFSAQYGAMSYHDFFQRFNSLATFQRSSVKDQKEFYVAKINVDSSFRLLERLKFDVNTSYSRQFKSDFRRGVVFGGGVTNYTNARFHQFYGLPYGDAFGNEILTARAQFNYHAFDIYRGHGFVPVFLKEIHLMAGSEIMRADRIFIEGQGVLTKKIINSFFAGPRFDLNVFYFVPIEAEIIFSHLTHSSIEAVNSVEFNFNVKL